MENASAMLLNRFFTRHTFQQLLESGSTEAFDAVVHRYSSDKKVMTNAERISEIYQQLQKHYRNEYYYKNTLLNKLLLGVHSPRTTTALTEVPVADSKADFILINGKAVVYEIKTELDNFERLNGQIADYYKAFSRVVVVTSQSSLESIERKLADRKHVGIYVLTTRGTISRWREPQECTEHLSKSTMFGVLRKAEYERIIFDNYGSLPKVSQFEYYRACKRMFEALDTVEAYRRFVQVLKSRSFINIEKYAEVPQELKFLVYFSNYRDCDYAALQKFLNE